MTHEQFITLETARLAKQAGFDWNVGAYYLNGYFYRANFYANYNLRILADYKTISAPTQSVLQRWLREVKNIQLWVEFHNQRSDVKDGWIAFYGFYSGTIVEIDYTSIYSTYEAALEAGLQKCLTLLISEQ